MQHADFSSHKMLQFVRNKELSYFELLYGIENTFLLKILISECSAFTSITFDDIF